MLETAMKPIVRSLFEGKPIARRFLTKWPGTVWSKAPAVVQHIAGRNGYCPLPSGTPHFCQLRLIEVPITCNGPLPDQKFSAPPLEPVFVRITSVRIIVRRLINQLKGVKADGRQKTYAVKGQRAGFKRQESW